MRDESIQARGDYVESEGKSAFVEFVLRWNNELIGTVTDSEGKAFANAKLYLTPASVSKDQVRRDLYAQIGSNEFGVKGIEPGKYQLFAKLDTPLGLNNVLEIKYAENLSNNPPLDFAAETKKTVSFSLPNLKQRKLTGEVITDSGSSVGGFVHISLDSSEDKFDSRNHEFRNASINALGQFEFNSLLEGEEYWLHIWLTDAEQVGGRMREVPKILKTERIRIGEELQLRKFIVSLPLKQ